MSKRATLAAVAMAWAVGAAAAAILTRIAGAGFGPPIHDDASLNANIGTLGQVIAWQNMPASDAFAVALPVVDDAAFNQVRLVSLENNPRFPNIGRLPE